VLPQTQHVDAPTSHVDWSAGKVALLTEHTPWPETGRSRRAGISSFGISGTNAHVIVEQVKDEPGPVTGPTVWPLSGTSPEALQAQAQRLLEFLRPDTNPIAVGQALARRTRFDYRSVATDLAALEALAGGREAPSLVTGKATDLGKTVFVFPGQGAQWI